MKHWFSPVLIVCCVLYSAVMFGQSDSYTGSWQQKQFVQGVRLDITLQVGIPERNLLFPARLTIQSDSFNLQYELLLVRKNLRQVSISKFKFAVSEVPYSIDPYPVVVNGLLEYSRDLKGDPLLTLRRLVSDNYGEKLPEIQTLGDSGTARPDFIIELLRNKDWQLKKINNVALESATADKLLEPTLSPVYSGILDTVHVQTRDGLVNFAGNRKSGNDIGTVTLNGKTILDEIDLGKKRPAEEILLDTGLNILIFFADNFSKKNPNKGRISIDIGKRTIYLNFNNQPDIAAGYIVLKLYVDKDKNAETKFSAANFPGFSDKPLQRNEKLIGSLVATSAEVVFAIWDDAVEDGDSISLSVNGKWIAEGFPVKKNPQFITVTLQPGPNQISFVANNVGTIPPNTSVLEIIDGKKRKSYTIETTLDENNLLRIYYDFKPEDL